ncbi:membrane protease YdiL (CAAX protease family) [Aquibacillus albus]|uniref:Membrane protease YdiL (CAAX protease family) n=1 Tax=Aquibacillus albus TaxID=1168171 RepID=A0ABS2MV70_9BACI|nr:membrane protease YdiL (CAAX protease family) [Aquibacillus albus]
MKQAELIKQMSSDQLKKQLYFSQSLLLFISLLLSVFLFDSMTDWFLIIQWNLNQILIYGVLSGIVIVLMDICFLLFLPKRLYDDGGINVKIFSERKIHEIFFIAFFVSISEEMLFRGVLQTEFGYIFASLIFTIVHVRYLVKPVLCIVVLLLSFWLGYLFEVTNNLLVPIVAHFIIDFCLAILIRGNSKGVFSYD